MSDETVEVKVKLPKPPEGWEYTGEYRRPKQGEWYRDHDLTETSGAGLAAQAHVSYLSHCLILRRVAPPERMVTLTLPERIVKFLSDHEQWHMLTGAEIGITAYAARKALAQEACGRVIHHIPKKKWTECDRPSEHAGTANAGALPKGHEGEHRP